MRVFQQNTYEKFKAQGNSMKIIDKIIWMLNHKTYLVLLKDGIVKHRGVFWHLTEYKDGHYTGFAFVRFNDKIRKWS